MTNATNTTSGTQVITFDAGEDIQFNFAAADIQQIQVLNGTTLEITLTSGQKLLIENYEEIQNENALMSDGQSVALNDLVGVGAIGVTNLEFNKPDTVDAPLTYEMSAGQNYTSNFTTADVQTTTVDDNGNLVITFTDGTQATVLSYAEMQGVENMPTMTLTDGTVIPLSDLLVSVTDLDSNNEDEVVVVTQPAEDIVEIAQIEPASGEPSAADLAAIEPAAGDAVGALGNTGASFGSSVSAIGLDNVDAVGPIGVTSLQFDRPEFEDDDFIPTEQQPQSVPNPFLTTNQAAGFEDTAINFGVFAQPSVPSESVVVELSGIPAGWTPVNSDATTAAGVFDPNAGTWTLTLGPGESIVTGPLFTPPLNSDEDISPIDVTVTQSDGGVTTGTFDVTVDAVADPVNLNATDVVGFEDNAVALNVSTSLIDTDGSEEITEILITNVPAGFALNLGADNGNGTWTIDPLDLPNLELTAPEHYSGTVTLGVVVSNEEVNLSDTELDFTNNDNVTSTEFNVTFTPVADAPSLIVNNPIVKEDGTVDLEIQATLEDPSEELTVTVENLDASWDVSIGSNNGTYDSNTGIWTITLPAGQNYNGALTLSPPADSDADMTDLVVTATSTEANATTASVSVIVDVVTDAVADTPVLTTTGVSGTSGTSYALNIATAVTDVDGSETLSPVTISGVPNGFTLNAGTEVTPGVWEVAQTDLGTLQINTPVGFDGSFDLTVAVTVTDNPTDTEVDFTDNELTVESTLSVNLGIQVPEVPEVQFGDGSAADGSAQVFEDGTVFVPITASLAANALPSEVLTVTVTGIDSSWTVNTGLNNGTYDSNTGTWTITLPAGQDYTGGLTFMPPADSDIDLTGLVATAEAFQPTSGDTATATNDGSILVDAVADMPSLNVNNANGLEGQTIDLDVSAALTDVDGSETLSSVTISGVPTGFSLTVGTETSPGVYDINVADLPNLALNTPSNFSGNVPLTVSVTSTEQVTDTDFDLTNNEATNTLTMNVAIADTANPPQLVVDGTHQVSEDGSVFVPFSASIIGDNSEVLTVTVSGIDTDWTVDTGADNGTYDSNTGVWTITMPAGQDYSGGLTFFPPADSDVDMTGITVQASAFAPETNTTSTVGEIIQINTDAVADMPDVDAGADASVTAGQSIALNITTDTTDVDGSETLGPVTISGVPAGYSLSAGTEVSTGVWEVAQADIAGLELNTPVNGNGNVTLTVSVTATETVTDNEFDFTNNTATNDDTVTIAVNPDQNPPEVTFGANGSGSAEVFEDGSVFVPITASLVGTALQELTVTVTGIDSGWTVDTGADNGTYNANTGTWTITLPVGDDYNGGLTFTPPANSDVDMTGLTVTATSRNTVTNTQLSSNAAGEVIVDAVADMPTLNVTNANGFEGETIDLDVTAALNDLDGSETMSAVTISGVPNGFSLTVGTETSPGVYQVSASDLSNLALNTPGSYDGNVVLSLTVTSTEQVTDTDFDLTNNVATNTDTLLIMIEPAPNDVPDAVNDTVNVNTDTNVTGNVTGNDYLSTDGGNRISNVAGQNVPNGGSVTINGTYGVLVISSDGSYTYNPNSDVIGTDTFNYTLRDVDGDSDTATLRFNVNTDIDHRPDANNDRVTMWSCDWATIGNVITGYNQSNGNQGRDNLSADGGNELISVRHGNQTHHFKEGGNAIGLQADHGIFFFFKDGTYTYISQESSPRASDTERVTYTIADADGDTSSAHLDLSVEVVPSEIFSGNQALDRAGVNFTTSETDGTMIMPTASANNADNTYTGNVGNDALYGWIGDDTLYGMGGNDVMMGEQGNNTLYGGSGSDMFVMFGDKANNNNRFDVIKDFNVNEGDVLSLGDVISGFGSNDDINDFVRIQMDGTTAVVQVNSDGAGTGYHTVARIESHSGLNASTLNVDDLFDKGHIDVY